MSDETRSKIYTRTGDAGETGLFAGGRVRKSHPRVEAYGAIDELNAHLGLARALGPDPELDGLLARVQAELFQLGADLATPLEASPKWLVRVEDTAVAALEREIDRFEAELEPLRNFILPGGSPVGAALHVARTVCRRAERHLVRLAEETQVNAAAVRYVNRLSDWLFDLARLANHRAGKPEHIWMAPQRQEP
ncbi:MAG: cob(I)yrinic acid a,c-diamide adenosyltransferase [Chloroflexi bacterium]|nr:cob(I)yrinic acid a,c-diamide adenosyltransferase [Chloroflexota bacterium]